MFQMLRNQRGIMLVTIYMVAAVLFISGAAYFQRSIHEAKTSETERFATSAFYIAEGAVEQILFDLRKDMTDSGDWFDGAINGLVVTPLPSWVTVPYSPTGMGEGTFQVEVQSVTGRPEALRIRATGTTSGVTRRILVNAEVIDLNVWNNAIFAGAGQGGNVISGNVDVRGSVHLLGTSLTPSDLAMDLGGGANIGNHYTGIPPALSTRLPLPPVVNFNGELVDSLGTEVRIKNGKLGLSGTALAGSPDTMGNSVKETVNGMFVTNGYGGNQGTNSVYSDNGTGNGYDGGDAVTFKLFSDPYKDLAGTNYPTYTNFVQTKGLNLSSFGINRIDPDTADFGPITDANGNSIAWTAGPGPNEGTLAISGVVYTTQTLDLGKKNKTVKYTGVGTMVAVGVNSDIEVHGDLLSQGTFVSADTMAFIAQRNVEIATGGGESQLNITGLFYGQNQIQMDKQSQLAGTFFSNYFVMEQTPSIYQVPSFDPSTHPGLIGWEPIYYMKISSWQEVQ